jgi:hypothetical protein
MNEKEKQAFRLGLIFGIAATAIFAAFAAEYGVICL